MKLVDWIKERWDRYQAQKRSDELWNRLHRHSVKGKPVRFTKKAYIKFCQQCEKAKKEKK